jgi:hypothetical protein
VREGEEGGQRTLGSMVQKGKLAASALPLSTSALKSVDCNRRTNSVDCSLPVGDTRAASEGGGGDGLDPRDAWPWHAYHAAQLAQCAAVEGERALGTHAPYRRWAGPRSPT